MERTREAQPLLPWVVLAVAVLAYVIAIVNRSSLASLGPATQHHFDVDATTLSLFAVVQLIVYATMQIPVGNMLDRYGSTIMILSGAVLMIIGQVVMATVDEVSLAILARILVGAGDACTFTSVIRLLPDWFPVRQLPVLAQVLGLIGALGQLISVTPLALAVDQFGWTSGFLGVAAVGFLALLLAFFVLRDTARSGTAFERIIGRQGRISREARSLAGFESTTELQAIAPPPTGMFTGIDPDAQKPRRDHIFRKIGTLLKIPGVRLGFWLHFTPPFTSTVVMLLWGTPFLTGGVGKSVTVAAGLLSVSIFAGMVWGLVLGPLTSRYVERRVHVVIVVVLVIVAAWLLVLLWPGTPPYWTLVVLMVILPSGNAASMVAFEVARSHAPRSYLGLATGMANMGGFISALIAILCIGLALDFQGAGSPDAYSMPAFRVAMATQLPIVAIGLTFLMVEWRKTRAWMRAHGRSLR